MKNKNLKKVMKMIGTGVYVNVWMMCSNTIAVMADPVSTGVTEVDTIFRTCGRNRINYSDQGNCGYCTGISAAGFTWNV